MAEHEKFEAKYIQDLLDYWNACMESLINEIFVGVGVNLGLTEKQAYALASRRPGTLEKAGFFKNVFDRFKFIFRRKPPEKFRYNPKIISKDKKVFTPEQWDKFDSALADYWKKYADTVTGDVTVKAHMLGKQTTEYRKKKKPYQNKSLYQVVTDQYDGKMPDSIEQAYKNYDFKNAEKKSLNKSLSDIAMYVTECQNDVREAIRKQVTLGIADKKSPVEIASDMYWNVEKDPDMQNKYSAESLRRNWNRVAATETAMAYEAGILAPYESDAMESIKDPGKARYFVRVGGTCEFCAPIQGTIMRLIPAEIADPDTNKLSDIGIKDPNTNFYTYNGQNNVGRKRQDWFITATPAHPYNKATKVLINLKDEWYNPKTGNVEKRQEKKKYIPQMEDYQEKVKREKEQRKPVYVGDNLVRFNNNLYESVPAEQYNKKLEQYRNDTTRPIPVNITSPSYKRIFEEAEKND